MSREIPSLRWREIARALNRLDLESRERKGHLVFYPPDDWDNGFGLPRHHGDVKRAIVLKLLKWLEKLGISRDYFLAAL